MRISLIGYEILFFTVSTRLLNNTNFLFYYNQAPVNMYYGQKANDVVLKEGYFISDGK